MILVESRRIWIDGAITRTPHLRGACISGCALHAPYTSYTPRSSFGLSAFGGPTKRGRESQKRIVQATLTLIEKRPFDQLTIAEIMEEAGMAVGTFYRRFKTKGSVLPFVFRAYDDLFEDWARSFAYEESKTRDQAIELVVQKTAQLFLKNAGLIRTVHLYNRLHPGMSMTQPNRSELSAKMGALLAVDFDHPTKDDLIKGRMAIFTMVSVMTEHFLYRDLAPAKTASLRNKDVQELLVKMTGSLAA